MVNFVSECNDSLTEGMVIIQFMIYQAPACSTDLRNNHWWCGAGEDDDDNKSDDETEAGEAEDLAAGKDDGG